MTTTTRSSRAALVLGGMVVLTVSGCSPVTEGVVGLTVDTAGNPVALLAPCDTNALGGEVDDVGITRLIPGERGADAWDRIARWGDLDLASDGELIEFPLDVALEPGQEYLLWADEPGQLLGPAVQLAAVDFTAAEVAGLAPGEVLANLAPPLDRTSVAEFAASACDTSHW